LKGSKGRLELPVGCSKGLGSQKGLTFKKKKANHQKGEKRPKIRKRWVPQRMTVLQGGPRALRKKKKKSAE